MKTHFEIEISDQFEKALDLMENTSKNVFITGRAGTGKSTLLSYFRNITKKNIVVLAPTGVAAINVKGQTIHSFFKFKPDITLDKVEKIKSEKELEIYKNIDAIVIDEISMVRSDLLDCIDKFLRLNGKKSKIPFGGVQMIFIGDLYQLPPVVTSEEKSIFRDLYESPYFFDAKLFENFDMEFIELEKVYRQHDEKFVELLNAFRNKTIDDYHIEMINSRYKPEFTHRKDEFLITLTSTNKQARKINEYNLSLIDDEEGEFFAEIEGEFDEQSYPTDKILLLKVGAQVMLLNNDSMGRWVNGTIGIITDIYPDSVDVQLEDGEIENVEPYTWEIFNFEYDKSRKSIYTNTIGSFKQLPLKLAWAITIHKSQGLTFDKVIIDIGHGTFAHGQLYVALSRCRTLDGIILNKKIQKHHAIMDSKVMDFITKFQYKKSDEVCSLKDKVSIIEKAISANKPIKITYLKTNDTKTKRVVIPTYVGEMEYSDKKYIGFEGHCKLRNETRVFRVDRILEMEIVD